MDKSFYLKMLNRIDDGIYFIDKHRKITFWNKGAEIISGFSSEAVVNTYCYDNVLNHIDDSGNLLCHTGCPLEKTLLDLKSRASTVYLHHKDGHRVKVFIKTYPIFEGDELIGAVEVFNEVNQESDYPSKQIKKFKELALRDQLTHLPNRRYIDSIIKSRIDEFKNMDINFGLLIVQVNCVNNDTSQKPCDYNQVFKMISKTLIKTTRQSDIISRWSKDAFAVLLTGLDQKSLHSIGQTLLMVLNNSSIRKPKIDYSIEMNIIGCLFNKEDTFNGFIKRCEEAVITLASEDKNFNVID